MCSPEIALGAQSFGAGMSAFGGFFSAKAQKSALRSQARIADINAQVAEEDARQIVRAGGIEESRIKLRGAQAKGSQIAQMSAGGIDIAGSPTALARLTGTDLITEVDATTIRANALRAAAGQRMEAVNFRNQALGARATASGISPGLALATGLIEGAGKVASSWYGMNKEGAFESGSRGFDPGALTRDTNAAIGGMGVVAGDRPDYMASFGWDTILRGQDAWTQKPRTNRSLLETTFGEPVGVGY